MKFFAEALQSDVTDIALTRDSLTVRGRNRGVAPISLRVDGQACEFAGGTTRVFPLGAER